MNDGVIRFETSYSVTPYSGSRFLLPKLNKGSNSSMRYLPDKFLIAIVSTALISSAFPLGGEALYLFSIATQCAVALLFFFHGARLSGRAVLDGLLNWRLHLTVFISTFVIFPILGLTAGMLIPGLKESTFYIGIIYLCLLPSTVQSSIAFTSIAGGNVSAAIVSASGSSILGMFIPPLLLGLLLSKSTGYAVSATVEGIAFQLLVPFVLGQVSHRWIGNRLARHPALTSFVDQGSIVMVVYLAFSEAMQEKLWSLTSWHDLGIMIVLDFLLLALILPITWFGSKLLGFNRQDRITIMFCGSKKSLSSGAPMANAIFSSNMIGSVVLPLMLYHQIQLMACSAIARRLRGQKLKVEEQNG